MHNSTLQINLFFIILIINLKYICAQHIIEVRNETLESTESNEELKTTTINDSSEIVVENWFIQKLDHFNSNGTETWKMRYYSNKDHFECGGPILIYVGGEWNITADKNLINNGKLLTDIAKETGGYLIYLEHRYYGDSQPFRDLSFENLKYLTIDQSLADLSHFIKTIKAKNRCFMKSKVILVGCSYGGSLVTWFMEKYPGIAVGAWASSAPLSVVVEFSEYMDLAEKSIKYVSEECYERLKQIIGVLDEMLTVKNITKEFKEILMICDDFDYDNQLDRWTFFEHIADAMISIVQDNDYDDLKEVCSRIEKTTNSIEALDILLDLYDENNDDFENDMDEYEIANNCSKYSYNGYINKMNSTKLHNVPRAWQYQICTQIGWFQPTSINNTIFGKDKFPIELAYNQCNDLFGIERDQIYRNIENAKKKFSNTIKSNNIIWTNGQIDPWRVLGMDKNPDGSSTEILKNSHCGDFDSIGENDTFALKEMKLRVKHKILDWIENNPISSSLKLVFYKKLLLFCGILIILMK